MAAAAALGAQAGPPDAGQVQRTSGIVPVPPPLVARPGLIPLPKEARDVVPGGPSVLVRAISVSGNTVFTTARLQEVVADQLGRKLDLAGMRALARRISEHYRLNGYPFAKAVVRVQEFQDDTLKLTVLEGRYGAIKVIGEPALAEGAAPFLTALRPGELLAAAPLERTVLVLDGIPGLAVIPSVSPGAELGTSDLAIALRMNTLQGGDVGVDNAGSRYTGYYRAHVSYYRNSLSRFGDRASLLLMVTDQGMLLGSLDYDQPLGGHGLRWQVGFSRVSYTLGEEYAALDATGLARVWSTALSYPLLRSQSTNVTLSVGLLHKDLRDDFAAVSIEEAKTTFSVPIGLRFDRRDGFLGGAVSYGGLSWTSGHLTLDDSMTATDAVTARKAGNYGKVNFDLARIQSFTPDLSLYGRFAAQWATGNLDSSERLAIGGFEGVRAYPVGEGSGDAGWLAQIELRRTIGDFAPYLLYDASHARINHRPWDAVSDQSRSLSGVGLGVRYAHDLWSGNLNISWRLDGGEPTQDVPPVNYRIAFSLSRNF